MCCGRPFARLISCAPSVPIRRAAAALDADGKSHVMTLAAPSCEEGHVSRNIAIANDDPQAVILRLHSTCLSALVQTVRWKRGIILLLHQCPPTGGSHGKLHPKTKIFSHARRR